MDLWMQERNAQLRQGASKLYGLGVQAYAEAIRKGEQVKARTTAEVIDLGRDVARRIDMTKAALQSKPRPVTSAAPVKPSPKAVSPSSGPGPVAAAKPSTSSGSAKEQLRAAVSGAADEFTFGLADRVLAAGDALAEEGLRNFAQNYQANMEQKRADDEYDARHYGLARNSGRAVGMVGSLAAMGAPAVARSAVVLAPRVFRAARSGASVAPALTPALSRGAAQAQKLGIKYGPDPLGLTKLAVVGGAGAGATDQYVGDMLTGRQTDLREMAAAAVGGALGGLATRYAGATAGGASGGATTSVLQDFVRGDDVSFDNALRSAQLSGLLGGVASRYLTNKVSNFPSKIKGNFGEVMSGLKAVARDDDILQQQARVYLKPVSKPKEYTVADHVLRSPDGQVRYNESKLGPSATLTDRQVQAMNQFGDRYIVDHWRFADVGKAGGMAVAPFGFTLSDDEPSRWR
ncbi:hypothetical protein [Phenylobacterium sp. SCN 70-31]|uniref:hypothetical protein n=1 Tax=Phenylobacterium sp. SCN 70-31 TaxID=1660129 RepID=UPI0025EE483B|nr:hypothetical protein [Phenylobacterium sp. SCN 70-31]